MRSVSAIYARLQSAQRIIGPLEPLRNQSGPSRTSRGKLLGIERHLETRHLCEKLGNKTHLDYKPAFILTKAQSVKFCWVKRQQGRARQRLANFLDLQRTNLRRDRL
jgi:hypothetical protein